MLTSCHFQFVNPQVIFATQVKKVNRFLIKQLAGNFVEKKGEGLQNDNLIGDDKENYTLMLTISADGVLCPPTLIFEYQTFPANVSNVCVSAIIFVKNIIIIIFQFIIVSRLHFIIF